MELKLALIICREGTSRDRVARAATRCGLAPICCRSLREARQLLPQGGFRVVMSEDALPDGDFRMAMRETRIYAEQAAFIVLVEKSEWEDYLRGLAAGVFEYILCPPSVVESETVLRSAMAEPALPPSHARPSYAIA